MWVVTSSIGFGETCLRQVNGGYGCSILFSISFGSWYWRSGLELSSEFFEFLVKEWSVAVFEESLMRAFSYGVCSYWGLSSIRWPLLTLEFDCLVWSLRSFGAVWMWCSLIFNRRVYPDFMGRDFGAYTLSRGVIELTIVNLVSSLTARVEIRFLVASLGWSLLLSDGCWRVLRCWSSSLALIPNKFDIQRFFIYSSIRLQLASLLDDYVWTLEVFKTLSHFF